MGSVYLAERQDGVFFQKVAVKVLSAQLDQQEFAAHFAVERELLAQMHHPNIVQLLDGGVTPDGQPYLVTEYIAGAPIDRFCDHQRLTVRQRVELFLQVCAAVEHAHQNLVIHRDLKPSNILVAHESGIVKLLDFGTAKLLQSAEAATVTEVHLLTPKYASPEQLTKAPLTTRTDVYSLGMILYELLSGHRPYGDTTEAVHELARAFQFTQQKPLGTGILEEDASRRGVSTAELARQLRGDLRVICAKALEHDPARRYASVRELAADLESWLASRPVSARPATWWYRASKFLYRQRYAAGATLLLILAAATGFFTTIREKRLAERRFADVRQLAHYQLFDLYDQILGVPGTTRLRANLATEGLKYLDALAAEASGDESLAVELAQGYLRVGDVTGNYGGQTLGNWQQALESYARGLKVIEPFDTPAARRTRTFLEYNATVARHNLDPQQDTAARLQDLVRQFAEIAAADPRNEENHWRLGRALQSAGRALQWQRGETGLVDVSADFIQRAHAAFEKGLERNPESPRLLSALFALCGERAMNLSQVRPQESLRWASEAEMWYKRLPAEQRRSVPVERDWASLLQARGMAMFSLGQQEEGLQLLKDGLAITTRHTEDPDNLAARMDLYIALRNLSLLEDAMGREADFLKTSERMLTVSEDLLRRAPSPRAEDNWLNALYNVCYAYSASKHPEADAILKRTFTALEKRAAEQPNDVTSRRIMADLLLNLAHPGYDQPDRARVHALRLTQIAPKDLPSWELLAKAELELGNYPAAVAALKKGISLVPAPREGEQPSALYLRLQERLTRYEAKLSMTPDSGTESKMKP
jgi:non-specific serine/threonine protein kinase/serine/threonine-protein kinase